MKNIYIVPYDPDWPTRFRREYEPLADVFRDEPAAIEHVGSTAVPGLGAKPIIDIMVGVSALKHVGERIAHLLALDYAYVPEYEVELPDRRYFRKPRAGPRSYHLHCVVRGGDFWRRHLAFRDYLRHNPDAARAYYELKIELAAEYRFDGVAYTEAKSGFIESILEKTLL